MRCPVSPQLPELYHPHSAPSFGKPDTTTSLSIRGRSPTVTPGGFQNGLSSGPEFKPLVPSACSYFPVGGRGV